MKTKKEISGEIISPETPGINPLFQRHLAAYEFCKPYVKGNRVLEVGFGEGYGVGRLSAETLSYHAVDVTDEWIEEAKKKYGADNITFNLFDGEQLPFDDASIDVVISMQVIEHIRDYMSYLREIRRVLTPSGIAILSTPNRKTMISGVNPYHYKEYSYDEIRNDLSKVFERVEVYGIFGSRRYMELKEEEQRLAKKILALDPFELRRFIPRSVIKMFYALAFKFVNRKTEERQGEKGGDVSLSDFYYSQEALDSALDFLCVCGRSLSASRP